MLLVSSASFFQYQQDQQNLKIIISIASSKEKVKRFTILENQYIVYHCTFYIL